MKLDLKELRKVAEAALKDWDEYGPLTSEGYVGSWNPQTAIALLDRLEALERVREAAYEYVMGRTIFKDRMGKALAAVDALEGRE